MADHSAHEGCGLKLYVDLGSQPARAVTIFCRATNIQAEEIYISVRAGQTRTPEYKKINPMGLVPCIDDNGFKLNESHAILRYLATTRNVADHWYPRDPQKRALVDSVLDWHHLNLRRHAGVLVINRVLAKLPVFEKVFPKADEKLAEESLTSLQRALDQMEVILGEGKFLQNSDEVSIADLSLLCELTQLQVLDSATQKELFGARKKITRWMKDVENATNPHFADVHTVIFGFAKDLKADQQKQAQPQTRDQ